MKQALLLYLKSHAIKDIILAGGLVLLAIGLDGYDRRIMEITIGGLLVIGGIIGYVR